MVAKHCVREEAKGENKVLSLLTGRPFVCRSRRLPLDLGQHLGARDERINRHQVLAQKVKKQISSSDSVRSRRAGK
jgi:hypothetical protein